MNIEEQIKAIYEKIAQVKSILIEVCPNCYSKNIGFSNNKEYRNKCKDCNDLFHNPTEIEGEEFKEVMIGDVLDYCSKNNLSLKLNKWLNFREPIEKQDDLCVSYIYNLIK